MELAGFDIIGELSVDTLTDFANSARIALPDGSLVYLFGGRFVLNLPLTVPALGNGSVAVFCDLTLGGIARSSSCALTIDLSEGAITFGGQSVRQVTATVAVTLGLGFVPDSDTGAPPNSVVPAILNSYATVNLVLGAATAGSLNDTFGSGTAAQVQSSISSTLQDWLRSLQLPSISAFSFTVVPGQDSHSPLQLAAIPQAFWIDQSTLGIFGYYRGSASGGNLELKTDSDIIQSTPEFIYTDSELFGVIPARRLAVLMSAKGFQLTVACPTITNQVVRGLLADELDDEWIANVRAEMGAQFYSEEAGNHLIAYFLDEESKNPSDLAGDFDRAKARVQADADNDIRSEANSELSRWLDSPAGQAEIANSVPPSCGNGSVQASRQQLPDPFSDVISTLRELDIDLQDGYVSFYARVDGNLPVCGGFTVTQTGRVQIIVDGTTSKVAPMIQTDPTQVDISVNPLCKVAASILVDLFEGVTWGTAIIFIGAAVAEGIGEGLVAKIIEGKIADAEAGIGSYTVPLPANSRLIDVDIETIGIRTTALLGLNIDHYNNLNPGLKVSATQVVRVPAGQPSEGEMQIAADPVGCPAATFAYTLQQYDTSFNISLSATDLPLPITVLGWQVQMGNFEYTSLGPLINDIKLPGPYWTGSLQSVIAPVTSMSGDVWHPVPPLDGEFQNKVVLVQASGTPESGWTFRFSGADGCFYVQITAMAQDGNGESWTGQTFISLQGETVSFGQDYANYQAACEKKKLAVLLAALRRLHPYVIRGRVLPGAPVESSQAAVTAAIRNLIRAGDRNSFIALRAAVQQFGKGILQGFANISQQGSGQVRI